MTELAWRHDCLRVCVAHAIGVEASTIPYGDVEADWDGAWRELTSWLRLERGWFLGHFDVGQPLVEYLADWGEVRYLWIAGVTHESWPEGWSHALVVRGNEVELYPPTGRLDPPLDELQLATAFYFLPLDPARFELGRERPPSFEVLTPAP